MNKYGQIEKYTKKARDIWMSRLFSEPVNQLIKTVYSLQKHETDKKRRKQNIPKYMMFSAHDNTIANIWEFLKPVNFEYEYHQKA